MAITYHAGRRLQGLSTDSSASATTSGFAQTWGKDPSTSQFEVSGGKINFLDNTSSTGDRTWLDLQSIIGSAVSTTQWVLRFKFNFSTLTTGSHYYEFDAGLSDTTVNNMTSQNYIGVRVLPNESRDLWRPRTCDGSTNPRSGSTANLTQEYATGVDYYAEIKRTSASNWSISLSTTNAYDGDLQDNSYTDAVGATGLRYFKFGDAVTNSGSGFTMQGVCDVLEFYNGVTTVPPYPPANVQAGSRFEETDTRKIYHRFVNPADVSGTDLKVYWKFNDASGSIVNSAGNVTGNSTLGSDADLAILGTGTPVYKQESPSGISKSVEFGQTATSPNFGQGQYARTASNLSQFSFMCTGTPQFTVCFWAKSSSNTFVNNQNLLGDNMGDTTRGFKIYWIGYPDGDNYMTTSMTKTGGGNDQPIRGTSPAQFWVADGAWHFYVFTIDFSLGSNQGYMSRDISGSTYSYSKNTPTPDSSGDTSYPMNFRNDAPNNGYGVPPTTQYAEFSIWDRVLTSAEISKLYNSGNGAQLDNRWDEEGT